MSYNKVYFILIFTFIIKRSDAQSLLFKPGIAFSYSKVTNDIAPTDYLTIYEKSKKYSPLIFRSYEYMSKNIKNRYIISYAYQQAITSVGYSVSYKNQTNSDITLSINTGVAYNNFIIKGYYQLNKSDITKIYFHTGLGLAYTKNNILEANRLTEKGAFEVKDYKVNNNIFATFHTGLSIFTRADDRVDIGLFLNYAKSSISNLATVNMDVKYGIKNQIHIYGSGSYVEALICIKYNFQKRK